MKAAGKVGLAVGVAFGAVGIVTVGALLGVIPAHYLSWPHKETVFISVVKVGGQCAVVEAPERIVTKQGRTITWKIRARGNDCSAHDVSIAFEGGDPTDPSEKKKATHGAEISARVKPDLQQPDDLRLYVYQILLASEPKVMARGTLAVCPDWPCRRASIPIEEATIGSEAGVTATPTPTPVPGGTTPEQRTPTPASTPPPQR